MPQWSVRLRPAVNTLCDWHVRLKVVLSPKRLKHGGGLRVRWIRAGRATCPPSAWLSPDVLDAIHALDRAGRHHIPGNDGRLGAGIYDALMAGLGLHPALMLGVTKHTGRAIAGSGEAGQAMITDINDFFSKGCGRCERFDTTACSAQRWAAGLAVLRQICRDAGLVETVKWGHPCYMAHGRNIAIIGALRDDFRLSFFQAALMKDPAGVLEQQGPNTRHPDMIRFRDACEVGTLAPTITAYLQEAADYAAAGLTAPREARSIELPDELVEAMDVDPELAAAFQRLTPGRQRSYAIVLGGLKKPETRIARIARLRPAILAGKGAQER